MPIWTRSYQRPARPTHSSLPRQWPAALPSTPRPLAAGDTPLHLACACGHKRIVEALCLAGANTELLNDAGLQPLHVAMRYGGEVSPELRKRRLRQRTEYRRRVFSSMLGGMASGTGGVRWRADQSVQAAASAAHAVVARARCRTRCSCDRRRCARRYAMREARSYAEPGGGARPRSRRQRRVRAMFIAHRRACTVARRRTRRRAAPARPPRQPPRCRRRRAR